MFGRSARKRLSSRSLTALGELEREKPCSRCGDRCPGFALHRWSPSINQGNTHALRPERWHLEAILSIGWTFLHSIGHPEYLQEHQPYCHFKTIQLHQASGADRLNPPPPWSLDTPVCLNLSRITGA